MGALSLSLPLSLACGGGDKPAEDGGKAKEGDKTEEKKPEDTGPKYVSAFGALPDLMGEGDLDENKVALGKMLYHDKRLSKNHDISCNSCHMLDKYGVDSEKTSPGHKGQRGDRNSPTVYNAAMHVAQFWDGRAADVVEQAKGPVLNPVEMAMPGEDQVVTVLKSIPGYEEPFKKAFPGEDDPITYQHMADAIGEFERTLVTPAPFDAYMKGDVKALTDEQVAGFDLFVTTGCTTCHAGPGLGGHMYQKLGLINAYETEDEGRKKVTGKDEDLHVFKVPSLRNVAKTGPYFHDGSIATLDEAVKLMAHHQVGKDLTDDQVKSIVAFLESLTGELPASALEVPELPESGPDTPEPDAS